MEKNIVSKRRVNAELKIQAKKLDQLLESYTIYPVEYKFNNFKDTKFVDVEDTNLPNEIELSGKFLLKLKKREKNVNK